METTGSEQVTRCCCGVEGSNHHCTAEYRVTPEGRIEVTPEGRIERLEIRMWFRDREAVLPPEVLRLVKRGGVYFDVDAQELTITFQADGVRIQKARE